MDCRSSVGCFRTREFHKCATYQTVNHGKATWLRYSWVWKNVALTSNKTEEVRNHRSQFQSAFSTLKCFVFRKSGASSRTGHSLVSLVFGTPIELVVGC